MEDNKTQAENSTTFMEVKVGDSVLYSQGTNTEGAAEAAVDAAGSVVDDAAEKAEEAAVEAAEKAEEVAETAAEKVEEAAEEATEKIEEAAEAAAEKIEEASEKAAETVKEAEKAIEKKTQEPIKIKKKSKINSTVVTVFVVAAVVVLACLAFVGVKLHWFDALKPVSKAKLEVEDYTSGITIYENDVTVTDEMVQQEISGMLSTMTTTEEVTTGTVASGDTINMDFAGFIDETGEQFEGGTSEDYSYTVGSGGILFDADLVGKEIGQTYQIPVTFPEDYQAENLQGVKTTFEVTINNKTVQNVPEFDDAFAQEFSAGYFPETFNTTAEFEAYVRGELEKDYKRYYTLQALLPKETVTSYNGKDEETLKTYLRGVIEQQAAQYGYGLEDYALAAYGTDAETVITDAVHSYLDEIMLSDYIIEKEGIEVTDEGFEEYLQNYYKSSGASTYYDYEGFKESLGETGLFLQREYYFKYQLAMDAVQKYVTVEPGSAPEPETESSAEAESTEAESESATEPASN